MEPFFKKILKGSSFVFIASVVAALLAYAFRIVLARNLTPVEYGLFYAVFSFISLFLFCRDLGLNTALPKFISEYKALRKFSELKTVLVSVFCWEYLSTSLLCFAIYLSSDWLGMYFFKEYGAAQMIRIFVFYVYVTMLLGYTVSSFLGMKKIFFFTLPDTATNILSVTLLLIMVPFGLNVLTPAYAFLAAYSIVTLVMVFFWIRFFIGYLTKYRIKRFGEITKKLFTFSIPVMITAIGTKVLSRANTLILVAFATLDVVGVFNVVLPTAMMLTFFGDAIGAVSFPYISEFWAKNKIKELKKGLRHVHYGVMTFLILGVTGGCIFGKDLLRLFFGETYAAGAGVFYVLLFAASFLSISNINMRTLSGIGRPDIVTKITLICSVGMVLMCFLTIPGAGMYGAAYSLLVGYVSMAFSSFILARRKLNERNK